MKRWLLWIIPVLLLIGGCASAQEAEEITLACQIRSCEQNIQLDRLMDKDYKTAWYSQTGYDHWVEVTAPEGETIGGVYFQWKRNKDYAEYPYYPFQVEVFSQGEWVAYHVETDNTYMTNYVELPDVTAFRVTNVEGQKKRLRLCEMSVFGKGEKPDWVQVWEPTAERAELMVIVAHPDDEMLYMGGTIPYYAGEKDKDTVVVFLTCGTFYRELELLDALWTCGVRTYPVLVGWADNMANNLEEMYEKCWGQSRVYGKFVELYRKYKPLVVVTHDVYGEYGHSAHKVAADAVRRACEMATDPTEYKTSYEAYGPWDVPKIYLHLYSKNRIRMDWNQPLEFFDGKTALEMAQAGFQCHVSQTDKKYLEVLDSGPYDNAKFGLFRSLVGEDVAKNDFFENMEKWTDPQ